MISNGSKIRIFFLKKMILRSEFKDPKSVFRRYKRFIDSKSKTTQSKYNLYEDNYLQQNVLVSDCDIFIYILLEILARVLCLHAFIKFLILKFCVLCKYRTLGCIFLQFLFYLQIYHFIPILFISFVFLQVLVMKF